MPRKVYEEYSAEKCLNIDYKDVFDRNLIVKQCLGK